MLKRAAFASTDGVYVDQHFGRADMFYIYEIGNTSNFVERRRFLREPGQGHSASEFEKAYQLLADCNAVFVSKIGTPAANYLIERGLRIFEIDAEVEEIIKTVIEENHNEN